MTFYSGKDTSVRNNRPDFSFNTQRLTCLLFLDKLLHFSESLFSILKWYLKSFQKCWEDEKYTEYLVCSKCSAHVSNSLIYLCFLFCQFLCWQYGQHFLNVNYNHGSECWNSRRHGLGHRRSYLPNGLENSIACLFTHLQ